MSTGWSIWSKTKRAKHFRPHVGPGDVYRETAERQIREWRWKAPERTKGRIYAVRNNQTGEMFVVPDCD